MNTPKPIALSLVLLAALLLAANVCLGQVPAVTVSPSVTSNTYPGFITLNITGLTNTEQVIVQRWLDLNSDGIVEPGEPLLETFPIQDGGAMIIGGITNVSVPYDSNLATGAITTALNFGPPLTLMDITGQQIFTIVSPTGRFTPVTATLMVTNALLPQSASGVVYSNGIAGLPNALVVALSMPNQNYAGAAVADSGGNYHLTLPTGQYGLISLLPGYYIDQNLAPSFTLTNNVQTTNNISVTNSTGPVISGQVFDASTSKALGGVFMQLTLSGGSLFAVAFADTNGNYSASVTSNNWKIKIDSTEMSHRAYITPVGNEASVNAALGNVTTNIGLLPANALYYGRFTDNFGHPLTNYDLDANDSSNQFKANGLTDANGNYGVAVLNTTNTPWYVSPSGNNVSLVSYIVNSQINTITNNVLDASNNFMLLPVTAEISGQLTDNTGNPISGIGVSAYLIAGNFDYNTAFVDTDANGNYTFGATSGTWYVNANETGGHSLADAGYYDPATNHPVNIPPTNAIVNIVVYPASLPQFGQPVHVSNTQFNFNLYGANNDNYTVQASTNLATTNWFTLVVVSNLPSSPYLVQDFQATNGTRFYRAFKGP